MTINLSVFCSLMEHVALLSPYSLSWDTLGENQSLSINFWFRLVSWFYTGPRHLIQISSNVIFAICYCLVLWETTLCFLLFHDKTFSKKDTISGGQPPIKRVPCPVEIREICYWVSMTWIKKSSPRSFFRYLKNHHYDLQVSNPWCWQKLTRHTDCECDVRSGHL